MKIDFHRLSAPSLYKYAEHYEISVDKHSSKEELVRAVKHHFGHWLYVEEKNSLTNFAAFLSSGKKAARCEGYLRRQAQPSLLNEPSSSAREQLSGQSHRFASTGKRGRDDDSSSSESSKPLKLMSPEGKSKLAHTNAVTTAALHRLNEEVKAEMRKSPPKSKKKPLKKKPASTKELKISKPVLAQKKAKTQAIEVFSAKEAVKNISTPLEDADASDGEESGDTGVFCICQKGSYGEMIACDAKGCSDPDNWYHLACVGLNSAPEKWYCPKCSPPLGRPVGSSKSKHTR